MTCILITGMSGTGKSTIITELSKRGHRALDLDCDAYSEWVPVEGDPTGARPGYDWAWREAATRALLTSAGTLDLFVGGCAPNMGRFRPLFDHIVLLSLPIDVMLERLASRTTNPYGKRPEEIAQVLKNHRLVEPRLRQIATLEIDTSAPVDDVIAKLLALPGRTDEPSR